MTYPHRTGHTPVIPGGDRRCTVRVSKAERCNLLDEEHDPLVYVATLDTGGISTGGYTFVAVGETPEGAKVAVARAYREGTKGREWGWTPEMPRRPRTLAAIDGYWGIRVHGPIVVGYGIESEGL